MFSNYYFIILFIGSISDDGEHECTCETHILKDDVSRKAYYEHEIDDFDDIDNNCDSESVKKCVKICLKEVNRNLIKFHLFK